MIKHSLNLNEFKRLNVENQVEEVNKLIDLGQSITDIAKSIGLNERSIRNRLNNNRYSRNKDGAKLFQLNTGAIPTKEIIE